MNRLMLLALFGLLLLGGCMQMKTEDDCKALTAESALESAPWGESAASFDKDVVIKANVTCWHTAALGYVAKNNRAKAIYCCKQIPEVSSREIDKDTLYREFLLCIDSVATRLQDTSICQEITDEDYKFEKESCIRHATPPPAPCSGTTLFLLLALGSALFIKKGK